ncbi:MAG: hypothetical protein REH79_00460 [Spiroplasma sp.]|nr:hypothetical protein [Spiroplasma sp.]
MYLHALITLSVIGSILAIGNLGYILWQKRKYNIANQKKKQNAKGNKAKSMREINNQVKSNFIKTILNTKMMQVLLIFDGCFFTTILVLIAVFVWI